MEDKALNGGKPVTSSSPEGKSGKKRRRKKSGGHGGSEPSRKAAAAQATAPGTGQGPDDRPATRPDGEKAAPPKPAASPAEERGLPDPPEGPGQGQEPPPPLPAPETEPEGEDHGQAAPEEKKEPDAAPGPDLPPEEEEAHPPAPDVPPEEEEAPTLAPEAGTGTLDEAETQDPTDGPETQAAPPEGQDGGPARAPDPGAGEPAGGHGPEPEEEPLTEEQRRRAAEMTRTVQISIEKLLEAASASGQEETAEGETGELADAAPEPEAEQLPLPRRMLRGVGGLLLGMGRWLLLVIAFVALVASIGIAWLYSGATPDSVPTVQATFNGEELSPTSYSWHVPVVGNLFKRTYAKTVSDDPIPLTGPVENQTVSLTVEAEDCTATLTVWDAASQVVFEGGVRQFKDFAFTDNGDYTAELSVRRVERNVEHAAEVSGEQTYLFTFEVSIMPTVRLNTVSIAQGGVALVRVTGITGQQAPTLQTDLPNTGFVQGQSGWLAFLAAGVDQDTGSYSVEVDCGTYRQSLTLTVNQRTGTYKDYTSKSQLTSPFLDPADAPAKVLTAVGKVSGVPAWSDGGFDLPFGDSVRVELEYGTTEYVGRTRAERTAGTGTGRVCGNVLVSGSRGGQLIAPAAGTVVLAEDLGGDAGVTLVIDHGAGVYSVFYDLNTLSVKAGQAVALGQDIALTNRYTIGEVRVAGVSVEPVSVWRGECEAFSYY